MLTQPNSPTTAALRIADQMHRAFHGEAWHGSALLELLRDVNAATAAARPIADAHSIWGDCESSARVDDRHWQAVQHELYHAGQIAILKKPAACGDMKKRSLTHW